MSDQQRVAGPEQIHVPDVIYFDPWHVMTPAEVCRECSDAEAGTWVPASFCPRAKSEMERRSAAGPTNLTTA